MIADDLLKTIPNHRIQPHDGMTITAEVWETAHGYHFHHQRLHSMLAHGAGILSGLKVIASDPADSTVYVLPGVALDALGRLIVLREPLTYDLGDIERDAMYYLRISYDESQARPNDERVYEDGDPLYIQSRYSLEVSSEEETGLGVELARVRCVKNKSIITDARDGRNPMENEIDLRFRHFLGPEPKPTASIAICYTDDHICCQHTQGILNLTQALNHTEPYQVLAHSDVSLQASLASFSLVYLVGQDHFQLDQAALNNLYDYWQDGGTLFIENCRKLSSKASPAADESFRDMLESFGVKLEPLQPADRLLREPYFFNAPPAGFETDGKPGLMVGDGVIYSTHDYGCLWQGDQRDGAAARESIRAAMEWGSNIISYALRRQLGS